MTDHDFNDHGAMRPDTMEQAVEDSTPGGGSGGTWVRKRRRRRVTPSVVPLVSDTGPQALLSRIAFGSLLALTLAGPIMTFDQTVTDNTFSLVRQIGYVLIALLAGFAVRVDKSPARAMVIPWPILAALAFCWLSAIWAIDPATAIKRLALTTIVIWSVFLLVRSLTYEVAVVLVRGALLIALVANYAAVAIDPAFGTHLTPALADDSLAGDWRGVMAHKNTAGLVSALTVIFFVFDGARIMPAVRVAVVVGGAYFLYRSSSQTSVWVCVVALAIGGLFLLHRYKHKTVTFGILGVAVVAGYVIQSLYSDTILRTLHDPAAFTGRMLIWQYMWEYHQAHPLLGSGFGSFWNIGPASPIYRYSADWVLTVTQGHNGYLDLLIQIGPLGLALVLFATVIVPLARLFGSARSEGQIGALIVATFIFCLGHNLSESSLMDRDSIGQVFLMIVLAFLWTIVSPAQSRPQSDLMSWAKKARSDRRRSRRPTHGQGS